MRGVHGQPRAHPGLGSALIRSPPPRAGEARTPTTVQPPSPGQPLNALTADQDRAATLTKPKTSLAAPNYTYFLSEI